MLTVLAFTVSGCKKDDGPANYLQVGDTTIALSDGNVKFYGTYSPTTYNFDLDFVSFFCFKIHPISQTSK